MSIQKPTAFVDLDRRFRALEPGERSEESAYSSYIASLTDGDSVEVLDRNINLEMVQEGWAWHYKHFDNSPEFAEAELKAKAAKLGLWADTQQPVAPWEFREQQKQKAGNHGN